MATVFKKPEPKDFKPADKNSLIYNCSKDKHYYRTSFGLTTCLYCGEVKDFIK